MPNFEACLQRMRVQRNVPAVFERIVIMNQITFSTHVVLSGLDRDIQVLNTLQVRRRTCITVKVFFNSPPALKLISVLQSSVQALTIRLENQISLAADEASTFWV